MSATSFDLHGEDFWNPQGPYRSLHHINPARLQFIERFIDLRGQKILDIGCGGGILSEAMAHKGAIVSGIDLSEAVLNAANQHAAGSNLHMDYRRISSQECVAQGEQYDHITCMEMLEHVPSPAAILRDIHALLKPDGYAFISTLNRNLTSFFGAIVAAEYLCKLVPKGTHRHSDFIRPQELVAMAEQAGLTSIALSGMDYHPFAKTAFLSRNLRINYLLALQKQS